MEPISSQEQTFTLYIDKCLALSAQLLWELQIKFVYPFLYTDHLKKLSTVFQFYE